ncbi:hypothetical protein JCM10212_006857 [Sporobolomyces blumeae]
MARLWLLTLPVLLASTVPYSTAVYRFLAFHLAGPLAPITDPTFSSFARFPNSTSNRLVEFTARSGSPALSDYSRLALCEDAVTYDVGPAKQVVIASCDPTRWDWNTVMGTLHDPKAGQGALWLIDPLEGEQGRPRRVSFDWPDLDRGTVDFHPLGIDITRDDGLDSALLFAINHQANESTVEVFRFACPDSLECTAKHERTLSGPSFTGAPNSIALSSPVHFYLSHDHRYTRRSSDFLSKLANAFESKLALPLSYVDSVSISPGSIEVERAVSHLAFANGITLSPSGRTLVVATSTTRLVSFYRRDVSTNAVASTPYKTVRLPFLVDNLYVEPRGFRSPVNDSLVDGADAREDAFVVLATGHPSYLSLLVVAERSSFWLSGILTSLVRPFSKTLAQRVKRDIDERLGKKWEFDWTESRGMSWSVEVPSTSTATTTLGHAREGSGYRTLFQSNGKGPRGFGSSSTTVVGKGFDQATGRTKRWMAVVGLYEEGVKVVVEDEEEA